MCGLITDVCSAQNRRLCRWIRVSSRSNRSRSVWGGESRLMIRRTFLELVGSSVLFPSIRESGSQVRLEKYSVERSGVYDLRMYERPDEDRVHVQFLELRAAVSVESWSDAYAVARYLDDVVTEFSPELREASQYRFRIRNRDAVMRLEEWEIEYQGDVWSMDSNDYIRGLFEFPADTEVDTEEELHRGLDLFRDKWL